MTRWQVSTTHQSSQSLIMRKPSSGLGKGDQLIDSQANDSHEDIVAHCLVLAMQFGLQCSKSMGIKGYTFMHHLVLLVDLGKIYHG